jgi:ankyrin repeat protein
MPDAVLVELKGKLPLSFSNEINGMIMIYLDIDVIQQLGENNVPKYIWRKKGQYLAEAAEKGNLIGVKYLIVNNIANFIYNSEIEEYSIALRLSAENGYLDIFDYMANHAIEHDIDLRIDHQPLLASASNGHLDVVKCLVEKYGANIHADDGYILIECVINGHLHIVEYFIKRGLIIKEYILDQCFENGYHDIVKYIIKQYDDFYSK